jgi:protein O-mannosyl-transferase
MSKKKTPQPKPKSAPVAAAETAYTPEPTLDMPPVWWQKPWFWALVLVAVTFLTYLPSLSNGFTNWDDSEYIYKNPHLALTAENLPYILTGTVAGNKHPLTMLSLAIDHEFGGKTNAFPYHLTSLLWHLLNSVLVLFFTWKLSGRRLWVAVITAGAFALHPMHVESVAWSSARKDVLYTAFFMLGLLSYLRYLDRQQLGWLVLAFLMMILSVLAKPAAVVFGVVLLLIDILKDRPLNSARIWLEKVPFLLLGLAWGWVTLGAQGLAIDRESYSLGERLIYGSYGFISYLVKSIYWGGLSAFYSYPINEHKFSPLFYACVPATLAILGIALVAMRRAKVFFFGIGFYTVTIGLVLQIITIGSALLAERYTYVPYIGLFYLYAWGFDRLTGTRRTIGAVAFGLFGLACVFQTWQQALKWKDSVTLFTQAIDNDPRGRNAYLNRAGAYGDLKNYEAGLRDLNKADALKPYHIPTRTSRAFFLYEMGRLKESIVDYDWMAAGGKGKAIDYVRRGDCLLKLGRYADALVSYQKALELDPAEGKAYNNRAMIHFNQKNYDQAIADYDKALDLSDDKAQIYKNRGACKLLKGDYAAAKADFDIALETVTNEGDLYYYRSAALDKLGQREAAIVDAKKAKELSFPLPAGYLGL